MHPVRNKIIARLNQGWSIKPLFLNGFRKTEKEKLARRKAMGGAGDPSAQVLVKVK